MMSLHLCWGWALQLKRFRVGNERSQMRFSNVFLLDLPKCLWSVSQCLTTRVFGPWYWSRSNYWVAIVPPDGQSSGYECRKRYDYLLLTLNSLKLLKSESGSHLWLCNTMMPNNVLSMFPQYFQHSEPGRKNEEPMDYGVIVKKRHQWTSVKNDTIYMFYLHLPWYKFYRKYMLTKKLSLTTDPSKMV